MSRFKRNKNTKVGNLYYSLGLLQQMMISSSADHHDLLVVCQAQAFKIVVQQQKWTSSLLGGAGKPVAPPSLWAWTDWISQGFFLVTIYQQYIHWQTFHRCLVLWCSDNSVLSQTSHPFSQTSWQREWSFYIKLKLLRTKEFGTTHVYLTFLHSLLSSEFIIALQFLRLNKWNFTWSEDGKNFNVNDDLHSFAI